MATAASEEAESQVPRAVRGIVNARVRDGCQEYKVRFVGNTKADDAWVTVDAVQPGQVRSQHPRPPSQLPARRADRARPTPRTRAS
jgi:hypothetical protein